jgi:tetratricopeptide (TPR) repeat protein
LQSNDEQPGGKPMKSIAKFEPPPKMVEEIWNWTLPRYAARTYTNLKEIDRSSISYQEAIKELNKPIPIIYINHKTYPNKIIKGPTLAIRRTKDIYEIFLNRKKISRNNKEESIKKINEIRNIYKDNLKERKNSDFIKVLIAAKNDCNDQPMKYTNVTTTIKPSIEGWKYQKPEFQEAISAWQKHGDMAVKLFMSEELSGKFTEEGIEIGIEKEWLTPKSLPVYNQIKKEIRDTIEHEAVHAAQFIGEFLTNINIGLPPKKTIDPRYHPSGQPKKEGPEKSYYLIDREFHAHLANSISQLKQIEISKENFEAFITRSPFFEALLNHEPKKWEKAVKILFKEVTK